MDKKWLVVIGLIAVPLFSQTGKPCRWVLAPNTQCQRLEKEAAQRIGTAKTACLSSESGVSWSKTLRNPNTPSSLQAIRSAYLYAHTGYQSLPACRNADLILKFYVDKGDSATLDVVEAESGENVFHELRSIADEDADLHRLAVHFFRARLTAKTVDETYRTAQQGGCTDDEVFKVLSAYSDEELVGKHFACRDGSEGATSNAEPNSR